MLRIIRFGLVWFNGISTIVCHLIPNPILTHALNTWFANTFCWYKQLSNQSVLFLTIQFSIIKVKRYCYVQLTILLNISHLFINSSISSNSIKYMPIECYHFEPEGIWEQWQWRGTLHSPKLKHYWNVTIRLFNVISRTLIGGVLSPFAVGVFYSPSQLGYENSYNYLQWIIIVSYLKSYYCVQIICIRQAIFDKYVRTPSQTKKQRQKIYIVTILLRNSYKKI